MCEGSTIAAIAMTEPGAGSDLQGLRTSAIKNADGTYLLNGELALSRLIALGSRVPC
jgi:acyl-CoA dehydrogenase